MGKSKYLDIKVIKKHAREFTDTVAVRQHRKGDLGPMPRAEVVLKLKNEIAGKGLTT